MKKSVSMKVMSAKLVTLSSTFLLSACSVIGNQDPGPPVLRQYIPQYIDFTYKIDGKVQVWHSYLFGPGVKKCFYVGRLAKPYMEGGQALYPYKSPEMDNFYEQNGHIYQGGANSDRNVLGYPFTSRLGGGKDKTTGEEIKEYITPLHRFAWLCHSRIGSSEYTIYLKKTSALSIQEDIDQTKKLMGGAWREVSRWDEPETVQRGANRWTVFNSWNRANYLSDASEYWYLPLGDGEYYYHLIFTYKSAMRERNDPEYLASRAMFEKILDSFRVRKLTPEEAAAILNPEPIEPGKYRPGFPKK